MFRLRRAFVHVCAVLNFPYIMPCLPETTIRPLQRVQNAAARLITDTKPWDHITPVLIHLHWLPVNQRIIYKLCLQMHMIHSFTPSSALIIWLTWLESLQQVRHDLASGLPFTSSTRNRR